MRGALLLFVLFVLAAPASAELFVTHARTSRLPAEAPAKESLDLELRTHLLIRGVEVVEGEGGLSFRLPVSGAPAKGFADVKVLSEPLYLKILDVLKTRVYTKELFKAADQRFTAGAARRLGGATRAAELELVFGGELQVTVGVSPKGDLLWPTRRLEGGERVRVFDILDADLRKRVEDAARERVAALLTHERQDGREPQSGEAVEKQPSSP